MIRTNETTTIERDNKAGRIVPGAHAPTHAPTHAHKKKPPPEPDSVFFHKGQISVGTRMLCLGRLDPRSVWTVSAIYPSVRVKSTGTRRVKQREIKYLTDLIELRRVDDYTNVRRTTFQNLSYSAIWRLLDEA